MELGQRIRQARQEQGLSQRQLCGEEITRNMLSQIENGSARPSMDTLRYLAARLGKPVSWFLEEETVTSPNQQVMEQARGYYAGGEYAAAVESLSQYQGPDPVYDAEKYLLEALSLTEQATLEQTQRPVYAQKLLEQAQQAGQQTVYYTPALQREWVLQMAAVRPEDTVSLVCQLPEDDRELLLRAEGAMAEKNWKRAERLLAAAQTRNARWQLRKGQCAMRQGNYESAVPHLLIAETRYPQACIPALEICYRELEDYKKAYLYACKNREQ